MANESNVQQKKNNLVNEQKGMDYNARKSLPSFNNNYYKNNQNNNPVKTQVKRTILKEGIKKGAQAYGVPEVATEKILESEMGREVLDAASNSNSPAEGVKEVTKVVVKRQLMIILPSLILPIFLLLIIVGLFLGKLSMSGFGNSSDDVYKELKDKILEVESKYRYRVNIDENLIIATLISYNSDEEFSNDGSTLKNMNYMKKQVEKLALYQIITNTSCAFDSSTIRKIANNDGVLSEDNYNCIYGMEGVTYKLSTEIGDYNDDNSGSTYYWNLIDNDFIFDYYNEYMVNPESNTEENKEKIQEIIEYIYAFYELMDKSSIDSKSVCGDGITVDGVTMDFEEYIGGVLYNEIGDNYLPVEALKAMAISARSSALSNSDNCTRELHNKTNTQQYKPGYTNNSNIVTAIKETKGQYLVYNDAVFDAVYTTFPDLGSNCNVVCDNNRCSADLSYDYEGKLGSQRVTVDRYINGVDIANDGKGSCVGMSIYAIEKDANSGKTYDEILTKYYSTSVQKIISTTDGLINENGFLKRVERAQRDNPYYYSEINDYSNGYIAGGLEGECAWYAVKRTNEIIATMGLQDTYHYVYGGGNGRDFCYASDYQQFEKSTNPNDPTLKPGAIISWYDSLYGHVAVVEAVYRDQKGNITSIDVSEAGIGFGKYGINARTIINNSFNSTLKRKENCEGNGSGCQRTKNISIDNIKNLYGQQKFICYLKIVK